MEPMHATPHHPMLITDKASEWMGIRTVALSDGHASITMTLRPEMMNGFGVTHGGMIFAFADTAFAMACNSVVDFGAQTTVAAGADISFLRPSYAGQTLTAEATVRHQSGRSGLYDVQVFADASTDNGDDGGSREGTERTVIAEFRGRSRTISGTPTIPTTP